MSLYRVSEFALEDGTKVKVPAGQLVAARLTVDTETSFTLNLIHSEINAQDLSLRASISKYLGGNPVEGIAPQTWSLHRITNTVVGVMAPDAAYPEHPKAQVVALPEGSYWLNVLNVSNNPNSFIVGLENTSELVGDADGSSNNCDC